MWARLASLVVTIGQARKNMFLPTGDPGKQDTLREGVRSLGSVQFPGENVPSGRL